MESLDREDDSNSPNQSAEKTPAEILEEKKAKLRNDIRQLKELNFQLQSSMNISKFGDIKHLLKTPEPGPPLHSKGIPDVEAEYTNELFQLAGMRCTKFVKDEYVFNFYPSEERIGIVTYAVEIKNAPGKPAIGKWVMPMSVNLDHILQETPLNNAMDLKPFLGNCKHHIDCYTNRAQQYKKLESIITELSGCYLDSRPGYIVIILNFLRIQDLDAGESHNVILYLVYESNRVRPHKMRIEGLYGKTLADSTVNKLKTYFKYFKCYDLENAFEKTIATEDTPVVWKKEENPDFLDSSHSSISSSEMNSPTRKRKTKSTSSRRRVKRKVKETSLQNYETEHSERVDDPRPSLSKSVNEKGQKSARKKGKAEAAGPLSKKKSQLQKRPKKNSEPSTSRTNTSLKQTTLRFRERSS